MKIVSIRSVLMAAIATFAVAAGAQQTTVTTVVKNVTTTVVESVSVEQERLGPKKIAVFVQNRTRIAGMDDEVDGVRDRLSSALAEIDGLSVMDSAQVADTFRRYKVTVGEEKAGLVSGIFSGGSIPAISKMLGCDYIAAATIVNASVANRNVGGRLASVYTVRMTLKIMDSTGASVDGMPTWVRQMPILDAVDDPMNYYQMLFDQWSSDVTAAVAQKSLKWRKPSPVAGGLVSFYISTTIDKTVAELESQTKGANGEQLQELRRIAGGVTVEIDGAVVGSSPGPLKTTPGLHQMRVTRPWMDPYTATVLINEGSSFDIALEMSEEGMRKWGSIEALRADLAKRYADAARERGVRINVDTTNWRDVGNSGIRVIGD
jgi:hypothetical protein